MAKKKSLTELILENEARSEHLRLEPSQLATVHGVKVASVHERMSRLRRACRIGPSARQVAGAAALPLPPSAGNGSSERVSRHTPDADILDREARLRAASWHVRNSAAPVSVQALRTLDELDPNPPRSIGPPPPLTENERIERLARLNLAVGVETARRAFLVAYPGKGIEAEPDLSVVETPVPQEPSEPQPA